MNMEEQWAAVDHYVEGLFVPQDEALTAALDASAKGELPPIQVSVCQGKFLQLLAQSHAARNILEVGTLGGYSTIWLARALPPGGHLITLEVSQHHTDVARANIARAQLSDRVELRVGPAIETLPKLQAEGKAPFDLIFIDADKPSTSAYFEWAIKLSRRGTVIIVDNVVRKGGLIEKDNTDVNVLGMRKFTEMLATERRVSATLMQTVGSKGYDGFVYAVVL